MYKLQALQTLSTPLSSSNKTLITLKYSAVINSLRSRTSLGSKPA